MTEVGDDIDEATVDEAADEIDDDIGEGDEIDDAAVDDIGDGDDIDDPADDDVEADQSWAWHAVRVSGLFLAGLITWQFVMTFVVNDIGATTAATMTTRWRDSTWRTIEWVTLFLALAHGGLALVRAINASKRSERARRFGSVLTALFTLGLMGAVSVVALTLR